SPFWCCSTGVGVGGGEGRRSPAIITSAGWPLFSRSAYWCSLTYDFGVTTGLGVGTGVTEPKPTGVRPGNCWFGGVGVYSRFGFSDSEMLSGPKLRWLSVGCRRIWLQDARNRAAPAASHTGQRKVRRDLTSSSEDSVAAKEGSDLREADAQRALPCAAFACARSARPSVTRACSSLLTATEERMTLSDCCDPGSNCGCQAWGWGQRASVLAASRSTLESGCWIPREPSSTPPPASCWPVWVSVK